MISICVSVIGEVELVSPSAPAPLALSRVSISSPLIHQTAISAAW